MDPGKLSSLKRGSRFNKKKLLYVQQTLKLISNKILLCFTCCPTILHYILLCVIEIIILVVQVSNRGPKPLTDL